ncbi:MAG: Hsp20/alpha crystallin family protein [Planctomycetota bacterium]
MLTQDPFVSFNRLRDELNRVFTAANETEFSRHPAMNVWGKEDGYTLEAELPGLTMDDVEITVEDGVLSISGERKPLDVSDEVRVVRRERGHGKFTRTLSLDRDVDAEKISATLKDGVLTVTLPKKEERKPRRINVQVG